MLAAAVMTYTKNYTNILLFKKLVEKYFKKYIKKYNK